MPRFAHPTYHTPRAPVRRPLLGWRFVSVLLSLGLGLAQPAAHAQPVPEAGAESAVLPVLPARVLQTSPELLAEVQAARNQASVHYRAGQYDQALQQATRAYELLPLSATALNVAIVLAAVGRTDEGFRQLLIAVDLQPNETERGLIEVSLAKMGLKCQPARGWLRLSGTPEGAYARLGEVDRALTFPASRTVGLAEGHYTVHLSADGYLPLDLPLDVKGGAATVLPFALQRAAAVAGPGTPQVGVQPPATVVADPAVVAPPPAPARPLRDWGWGTLGAGLALAVGGSSLVGVGYGDLVDAHDSNDPGAYDDARPKYDAGVGMLVTGSLTAAAGAVLLIIDALRQP